MRMIRIMPKATPNRLREIRRARGLTQLDVAMKASLSQSTYWMIENLYREASPPERTKLARVLKSTKAELFPDAEQQAVAS
jgi:transcriptional regulator with XRE-family HTH domain